MTDKITVVCIHEHGRPEDVLKVEQRDLPEPEPNQVLVSMKASPVNPADINVIEGQYAIRSQLPVVVGNEGVGVVAGVGVAVSGFKPGQQVFAPKRMGHWCGAYTAPAGECINIPAGVSTEQAAMLSVNPPTAWKLLKSIVPLKEGDWVIQNGGNSGVGTLVIQLARHLGYRTVNVVRRTENIEPLIALGADVVLIEDEPLRDKIREAAPDARFSLALNCVGGKSAGELAKVLAPGGTLVTYGAMAMEPVPASNGLLIFKDIRYRGFWITDWYNRANEKEIRDVFSNLFPLFLDGKLEVKVERTYALHEAREAVAHAMREKRSGKVLFLI